MTGVMTMCEAKYIGFIIVAVDISLFLYTMSGTCIAWPLDSTFLYNNFSLNQGTAAKREK